MSLLSPFIPEGSEKRTSSQISAIKAPGARVEPARPPPASHRSQMALQDATGGLFYGRTDSYSDSLGSLSLWSPKMASNNSGPVAKSNISEGAFDLGGGAEVRNVAVQGGGGGNYLKGEGGSAGGRERSASEARGNAWQSPPSTASIAVIQSDKGVEMPPSSVDKGAGRTAAFGGSAALASVPEGEFSFAKSSLQQAGPSSQGLKVEEEEREGGCAAADIVTAHGDSLVARGEGTASSKSRPDEPLHQPVIISTGRGMDALATCASGQGGVDTTAILILESQPDRGLTDRPTDPGEGARGPAAGAEESEEEQRMQPKCACVIS